MHTLKINAYIIIARVQRDLKAAERSPKSSGSPDHGSLLLVWAGAHKKKRLQSFYAVVSANHENVSFMFPQPIRQIF